MPNEANALSGKPGAPSQGYYRASRAALSSAAREQPVAGADVQRSRQAVTRMLLAAIERLETEVASGSDAVGRYRPRAEPVARSHPHGAAQMGRGQ